MLGTYPFISLLFETLSLRTFPCHYLGQWAETPLALHLTDCFMITIPLSKTLDPCNITRVSGQMSHSSVVTSCWQKHSFTYLQVHIFLLSNKGRGRSGMEERFYVREKDCCLQKVACAVSQGWHY